LVKPNPENIWKIFVESTIGAQGVPNWELIPYWEE
jgi:hypothetical protein